MGPVLPEIRDHNEVGQVVTGVARIAADRRLFGDLGGRSRLAQIAAGHAWPRDRVADVENDAMLVDDDLHLAGVALFLARVVPF